MKYQLVLALLILGIVSCQYTCPKFSCGSVTAEDPVEVCARKSSSASDINFKLKLCSNKQTQTCNFSFPDPVSNCSNITTLPQSLLPGDPCIYPESCYNGICRLGVCVGKEAGFACNVDKECTMGTYCSPKNKTCLPLLGLKAQCGTEKGPCANHLTCNLGECTPIGSLAKGSPADNPVACDSLYLTVDTDGIRKCSPGPRLQGYSGKGYECNVGEFCSYDVESNSGELKLPCKCGVNGNGKGYCHPGEGNLQKEVQIVIFFAH
jgi:hypothetical protein